MHQQRLCFNGVDGRSGGYLYPPLSVSRAARLLGAPPRREAPARGPRAGVDPRDLAESGWGVVFPHPQTWTDGAAVREALAPLLEHRQAQATRRDERLYRELTYLPEDSRWELLSRYGADFGPVEPERVPYYLLLVGGPEVIPYELQHELDVGYAVGRIHFEQPDDYARYAGGVVAAESSLPLRRAAFFGVRHDGDRPTKLMADYLVDPLVRELGPELAAAEWELEVATGEVATRGRLSSLLSPGDGEPPAFLLTACHGLGFPSGDPLQREHQGALICSDWPGPGRPLGRECYFAGEDLEADTRHPASVTFHVGCHSAGTPERDAFAHREGGPARRLAPQPFVARLAQRLLLRGTLAVVGHVERAWLYSFMGLAAGHHEQVFTSTLKRLLLEGHPVGSAMEFFGQRHGELATVLAEELGRAFRGTPVNQERLVRLWTAHNDARSYAVVGDPAVRLPPAA